MNRRNRRDLARATPQTDEQKAKIWWERFFKSLDIKRALTDYMWEVEIRNAFPRLDIKPNADVVEQQTRQA